MGFLEKFSAPYRKKEEEQQSSKIERNQIRATQETTREKYYEEAIKGVGAMLATEKFGTNYEVQQQSQNWRFDTQKQIKDFMLKNPDLKDLLLNSIAVKLENKQEFMRSLEEKIVGIYKTQIEKESALPERKRA